MGNNKKHGSKKAKKKQNKRAHRSRSSIQPTLNHRVINGVMGAIHSTWMAGVNTVNFVYYIISSILLFIFTVVTLPVTLPIKLFRLLTRKTKKTQKNIIEEDLAEETSDPSEEAEIEEEQEEEKEEISNDARDEALRALEERVAVLEKALNDLKKTVDSKKSIPVPVMMAAPVAPPPPMAAPPPPPPPPPKPLVNATPLKSILVTPRPKPVPAQPVFTKPMISLADITNVRLKKASEQRPIKEAPTATTPAFLLRKIDIRRSPGGTPVRKSPAATPVKKGDENKSPKKSSGKKNSASARQVLSPIKSPFNTQSIR